jgi:transposase-like protein
MTRKNDDSIRRMVQGLFQSKEGLKDLLEILVNHTMQAEVGQHLGAGLHERSPNRRGYRNGAKSRTLKTRAGELNLSVPQTRGCEPYHPSMFHRWQRSERALMVACAEMYYQGVSTRRVQGVLEKMCGMDISSMTVSRVAAELDEKLDEFRGRRLDGRQYPYVLVDARYEKVRVSGHIVSQAVLVVAGYNEEGRREVLDWRVEDSESEETWGQVFVDLKARGLRGVELITSDAHQGIRKAIARHFQGTAWQRCHVHFKREVGRKVTPKYFLEVRRDISAVFTPMDRRECLRRGEEMAAKWEKKFPKLARMLLDGMEDCLSVLAFPRNHQRRLKSTNVLERLMREIKRRTRVVSIFPNAASCERLVGANLLEVHEKWLAAERSVLNLEHGIAKAKKPKRRKTGRTA